MTRRSLAIGLQSIHMHPTEWTQQGMKDYDTTFESMTLTSLAVHSNYIGHLRQTAVNAIQWRLPMTERIVVCHSSILIWQLRLDPQGI